MEKYQLFKGNRLVMVPFDDSQYFLSYLTRRLKERGLKGYHTNLKFNYNRHLKSKRHLLKAAGQSTRKTYKCDKCKYESKWSGNLKRHQKVHNKTASPKKGFAYHCQACNMYIKDSKALKGHVTTYKHGTNVFEKYPETTKKQHIPPLIIPSMRWVYIIELTKGKEEIKKEVPKKEQPTFIKIADYKSYMYLDEREKEKLIANAVKWMKENGIDPVDEGYSDDNEVDENYTAIHQILSDDPITYFKGLGIDVKNIQ